jgi:hypothetical protein
VVVFTKEGKYGLVDVTVEDCERKGRQLLVDEADFAALARIGLHSDAELERTRRITGRPMEEITSLGLPGAPSTDGFFRPGEDIVSVLQADNRLVRELGLTHPQLARPLLHVWNLALTDTRLGRWNMARHRWECVQAVFYNNKKVLLDAGDTRGGQRSIFDDEITGALHIEIKRSPDGKEEKLLREVYGHLPQVGRDAVRAALTGIRTGEMQPYCIMRYGFYEGHAAWRTDPVAIVFLFGLRSLAEIEKAFAGHLDQILTGHFTTRPAGAPARH